MAGTLRLTEEEKRKVEALKKLTGQKTDSGVIKEVINHYEELQKRYLIEISKREKAENQFSELKQKVSIYISTFQEIKNMINDGKK